MAVVARGVKVVETHVQEEQTIVDSGNDDGDDGG